MLLRLAGCEEMQGYPVRPARRRARRSTGLLEDARATLGTAAAARCGGLSGPASRIDLHQSYLLARCRMLIIGNLL